MMSSSPNSVEVTAGESEKASCCCRCFHWLWKSKIRKYLRYSHGAVFVSALGFADKFVDNAFSAFLVTYIQYLWLMPSLRKATIVVNLFQGFTYFLSIALQLIADHKIGLFNLVIRATPAMVIGLLLLWFTEWFYVHNISIRLFHLALMFMAVGLGGLDAARTFLYDQLDKKLDEKMSTKDSAQEQKSNTDANSKGNNQSLEKNEKTDDDEESASQKEKSSKEEEEEERTTETCSNVWWYAFVFLGSIIASTFTSSLTWKNTLMVSSIVMGVAYLFFCSGTRFYKRKQPTKDPFFLLMMEAKPLRRLLPLWTIFIVYSLVDAAGYTFFMEQSARLDDHIDIRIPVYHYTFNRIPLTSIYMLQTFTSFAVSLGFDFLINDRWEEKIERRARFWRIGIGMLFASGSCMMAWWVEVRRLHFMKELIIIDNVNTDDRILPMKVLWLVPQFFLLGVAKGLVGRGQKDFFLDRVRLRKNMMKRYEFAYNGSMLGFGRFVAAFSVWAARNWIGEIMEVSHLDKYLIMLAIVSATSLIWFTIISYKCDWTIKEAVDNKNFGRLPWRRDIRTLGAIDFNSKEVED